MTFEGPKDKNYQETIQWLEGKYEPEFFAPKAGKFDNPKQHFKKALEER